MLDEEEINQANTFKMRLYRGCINNYKTNSPSKVDHGLSKINGGIKIIEG
jgi:hypothetical protein